MQIFNTMADSEQDIYPTKRTKNVILDDEDDDHFRQSTRARVTKNGREQMSHGHKTLTNISEFSV